MLERLAAEFGGRFLLATVDVDANPQLAQAFQVQSIPTVFAVLKGQPLPLFQGALPEAQVAPVPDRAPAGRRGERRRPAVVPVSDAGEPEEADEPSPSRSRCPPLHQAAYDAIERRRLRRGDRRLRAGAAREPGGRRARIGLAQVRLLQRTADADVTPPARRPRPTPTTSTRRSSSPTSTCSAATSRTPSCASSTPSAAPSGADRDRARTHLVELFDVVGGADPRVPAARVALANAVFA